MFLTRKGLFRILRLSSAWNMLYLNCVDLNTLEDTWYIYPHDCAFSVTKMALATEELYYAHRRAIGRPCKPGLA